MPTVSDSVLQQRSGFLDPELRRKINGYPQELCKSCVPGLAAISGGRGLDALNAECFHQHEAWKRSLPCSGSCCRGGLWEVRGCHNRILLVHCKTHYQMPTSKQHWSSRYVRPSWIWAPRSSRRGSSKKHARSTPMRSGMQMKIVQEAELLERTADEELARDVVAELLGRADGELLARDAELLERTDDEERAEEGRADEDAEREAELLVRDVDAEVLGRAEEGTTELERTDAELLARETDAELLGGTEEETAELERADDELARDDAELLGRTDDDERIVEDELLARETELLGRESSSGRKRRSVQRKTPSSSGQRMLSCLLERQSC
ncbi:hypothetical protein C8R43DRAFT_212305 [Mycena crocata]|nr:hypothetical protein C8R43DRAFT_212305 [Mycena crocata]